MCPKHPPYSNVTHAAVNLRSQDQPGPSTAIDLVHPLLKVTSLMTVSVGSRMKIMAGNADQSLLSTSVLCAPRAVSAIQHFTITRRRSTKKLLPLELASNQQRMARWL